MEEKQDKVKSRNVEYSYFIKFTWKIPNFSTIDTNKLYSDVFAGGDHKWKLLIYPKGDKKDIDHLRIYLYVADPATLPSGWTRHVKFRLSVISEIEEHTVKHETELITFSERCKNWGFTSFMALDKLRKADGGFLVRDTCIVRVEVLFNEDNGKEVQDMKEKADLNKKKYLPSFADINTLFTNKDQIEEKTMSRMFSTKEFSEAKAIFNNCLNMDVKSFIRSGKALELKNALSLLLTVKAFPDSMVDETAKFAANFDQRCKKYKDAQRILSEAQEDEDSAGKVKTALKQMSPELMPVTNQSEAIDSEIARLEERLTELKARRALIGIEQGIKKSTNKKNEAAKTICEFNISWQCLKGLRSSINW